MIGIGPFTRRYRLGTVASRRLKIVSFSPEIDDLYRSPAGACRAVRGAPVVSAEVWITGLQAPA